MEITFNRTTYSSSSYNSNKSSFINITTWVKFSLNFVINFFENFFSRHVLKFVNTCPFAFNLQILSDTNDFMIGDEDQLLNKIISVPVKNFYFEVNLIVLLFYRKMQNL